MAYKGLTKKDEYLEELEERNQARADEDLEPFDFSEDNTNPELIEMLEQDDEERGLENEDAKQEASNDAVEDDEEKHYYMLKGQAYISETKMLEAGLYAFDEKVERLEGQEPQVISYGTEMTEMQIVEAGDFLGFDIGRGSDTNFKEARDDMLRDETNYRYDRRVT